MEVRHNPRSSSLTAVPTSDEPLPLPAEHVGSPTATSPASPGRQWPTSIRNEPPGRLKSATLSQPTRVPASRHRHAASTAPISGHPPEPSEEDESAQKTTDFLTALASQERRVLEIKEELRVAELNLVDLKKQWAQQESSNRRNESKRLHQMRPISGSAPKVSKTDDDDGSSAWMYEEMERRKALMNHGRGQGQGHARNASRRIFSGSRHAKTLSLIPPMKEEPDLPPTPPPDTTDTAVRPNHFERAKTTSDLTRVDEHAARPSQSPQREALQVGKQIATDWKDGLWTFFEDLKQATVGEDVRNQQGALPASQRKNSTTEVLKRTKAPFMLRPGVNQSGPIKPMDDAPLIDVASDFWKEHGLDPPKDLEDPAIKRHIKQQTPQKTSLEDDSWDNWADTPSPSHRQTSSGEHSKSNSASSTSPGASSPATSLEATPRQSVSSDAKRRDSIAWPALTKLGPAQLRRTASHLLQEWERSLTPPAEEYSRPLTPAELVNKHTAEQEMLSQLR